MFNTCSLSILPIYEYFTLPDNEYFTLSDNEYFTLPDYECLILPDYECLTLPDYDCFTLLNYECFTLPDYDCFTLPDKGMFWFFFLCSSHYLCLLKISCNLGSNKRVYSEQQSTMTVLKTRNTLNMKMQ